MQTKGALHSFVAATTIRLCISDHRYFFDSRKKMREREWSLRGAGGGEKEEEEEEVMISCFLIFMMICYFCTAGIQKSLFNFFLFCRITYVPKLNYSSSYILSYPFISVSLGQDFSILDGYHLHLQVFSFIGFFFFLHTRTQPHGGSSNAEPC